MNLTPEQQKEFAQFPAPLRALVEAELAAGNSIAALEHGFPAAPCGASLKLAKAVSETRRKSTDEVKFYARNNSSYAGEFTTAERHFFVLEPPLPPLPPPDMDAIRKAHDPKPDALGRLAQREAGAGIQFPAVSSSPHSSPSLGGAREPHTNDAQAAKTPPHFTNTETATGWTRLLHFVDKRPPHLVQFDLERELMVLFIASMDGSQLRLKATAHVNGARYDFEFRFLAALKSNYHYSLRTEASWADSDQKYHDYFRKTSDSWFKLWTRELMAATPPDLSQNLVERYQQESAATLQAQRHLDSVAAVQRAIVAGMKRGGTYGTSHKEGGTNIYWRGEHFVRSDYGDYPDLKTFQTEAEFLKMLWQFCQFDVTRHTGKQGLSELDAWKLILRRMSNAPPHPDDLRGGTGAAIAAIVGAVAFPTTAHAATTMHSIYSTAFAKWLGLGLVVLIFAGLAAWQFVSIKSTGTPLGQALRTETHVFQLILTQERYLPSLHRSPSRNRYRIDLLTIPLANPGKQETFTLIRQQQANAATPMTKILGAAGDVVWINALDTFAVNLRTKRVANGAALRKANPELETFLHSARPEFKDRFVMVSPDWSYAYEFSSETLQANACPPPDRGNFIDELSNLRTERSLCSGGVIGTNDWIAVATPEDAKSDFKVGFSLSRDFTPGEKDRGRQLYRGTADYSEKRPPIQSFAKLSEKEYRAATFLRAQPGGPIFRATNPDSVFLIHRAGTELFAPYTLTRLAPDGKVIWNAETGLGRLEQVLPGTSTIVLKGERTPEPNKVPEPIVVMVDVGTGASTAASLWR
jgi:hypothetical protein